MALGDLPETPDYPIAPLTAEDVEFEIIIEPEEISVDEAFEGDNEELKLEITEHLARGLVEAWCHIRVTARYEGLEGHDTLGGCSHLALEGAGSIAHQVEQTIEAHQMRENALDDLNRLRRNQRRVAMALPSNERLTIMSDDTRTMVDLANEAIRVQDACNLSGVVYSFAKAIQRLRVLLREQGRESTAEVNTHPICVAWISKMQSLARWDKVEDWDMIVFKAMQDCHDLAQR